MAGIYIHIPFCKSKCAYCNFFSLASESRIQDYVEALKKDKIFDADAQKEALQMTLDAVMNILTDEAKVYLTEAYGDLNAYIVQKIEAEVNMTK